MSLGICSACKNADSCTFPRNQVIFQCEEYENAGPHPCIVAPRRPDARPISHLNTSTLVDSRVAVAGD